MHEFRFDGRVAIITGAGRGLGRAYAKLLAERGASVVVNDLGAAIDGSGSDTQPAAEVVAQIVASGGNAIADFNDVSQPSGAQSLVDAAAKEFGRVDILINNAGNNIPVSFPDADPENLKSHMAIHLFGSYYMTRAAWPHMVEQEHGRIVVSSSTNIFGNPLTFSYPTVKAGLIGMARHIRIMGAPHNIKINAIAPAAWTRFRTVRPGFKEQGQPVEDPKMSPDFVAPMVAYLAHESCAVSGEIYGAGAGRFNRLFLAMNDGYLQTDPMPTIEDVVEHWSQISDVTSYYEPADAAEWLARFLVHVER